MTEALRGSNTEKLEHKLTPSSQQGAGTKAQDALDTAASYIPGQSKTRDTFSDNAKTPNLTHDTGRAGGAEGFKPAGQQTWGESIQASADRAASAVMPKSNTQEARDAATPGNYSHKQEEGKGVMAQVGDAIVGAKDAVAGAFGGGPGGAHGGSGATH